jgi:hypothetical protein
MNVNEILKEVAMKERAYNDYHSCQINYSERLSYTNGLSELECLNFRANEVGNIRY